MGSILKFPARFNHCNDSHQYALDVVSGKIPNCKDVINSCQRYLNDLQRTDLKIVYDPSLGNRACNFIELLVHTKAKWRGKQLILEPWQKFIVCNMFAWINLSTGFRRFREVEIHVPRKNGKSIMAAAIGLYMFCEDGEQAPEIMSGATSEYQAMQCFKPAKFMCKQLPEICEKYGVEINAKNLSKPDCGGKFEPIIGNPGDGASPSMWIVDEYHEHPDSNQVDNATTGMGSRESPILLIITTAGTDTSSPCYRRLEELKLIMSGEVVADDVFGIRFGLDDKDDYTQPGMGQKANPNYGISVFETYLEGMVASAVRSSANENKVKIKNFNIWVSAKAAWINSTDWKNCADYEMDEQWFVDNGIECIGSIDLSSKIDLTAWVRLYKMEIEGKTHYYIFGDYYLPLHRIEDPEVDAFAQWHKEGYLDTCGDDEIDYTELMEIFKKFAEKINFREIVYDKWRAHHTAQELAKGGLIMVEYTNSPSNNTAAMDEMEAAIVSGRLHHCDDPILNWMIGNVVLKVYPTGLKAAAKEKDHNKIDGPIAMIMAIGRAIYDLEIDDSVYDDRGVREI